MDMGYTLIPALIYLAGMGAFTVAFLVDWIRSFEQIRRYWRYAVIAAAALVWLNVIVVAIAPGGWSMMRIVGFVSMPLLFVRVVGFAMLGMHYCARLGYPSFLLLPLEPATEEPAITDAPLPPADGIGPPRDAAVPEQSPALMDILAEPMPQADDAILDLDIPVAQVDSPILEVDIPVLRVDVPARQAPADTPPAVWSLRDYVWDILIVAGASVVYSALLFLLTKPRIAEMVQRVFGVGEDAADAGTFAPFTILLVLTFAFGEEIFFRLGIQNFLARYLNWRGNRYWAAIALTSLLWTVGHAGVLDPDWVKFAQIYPVGLMLGWLFRSHGVEACMLAHGLFNVIMIGLSSILLT